MFTRTLCSVALALTLPMGRAAGQAPGGSPDLRALSLRSLQAGRAIRITGSQIGTVTGPVAGVRDGALWLGTEPAARRVPLAGIDSVWVSRGHSGTGALVGGLVGTLVAVGVLSGKRCELGDSGCLTAGTAELTAIILGGAILGSVVGGSAKTWELRYP